MATVQNATATAATTAGAATQASGKDNDVSADRFLRLLVAQMRNQDPLNPLDNAQVTSQMAQISTVEGIQKLNATLATLQLGFDKAQTLQAASMVGRHVLAEGNALALARDAASGAAVARGGYLLESAADGLTLTVKSAAGAVVHRAELGAQAAGLHVFEWDGLADDGTPAAEGAYTFEVSARAGKDALAAQPLALGRVDGITPGAGGATLTLGGIGELPLSAVKHIF
jgi:flagellar basal-body rod modification protein FlgD